MPTISAIIPLYNHGRYIEAALGSVLNQSSPVDEIFVIDDGSTDDGPLIAERVLKGRENARVIRQKNRGAHFTINRLVEECQGDFLAILNSDDAFAPEKIERCRAILKQSPDIDLLSGKIQLIDENGSQLRSGVVFDWLDRAARFYRETKLARLALLNENFVATTSNMVFSRALWKRCGGFQNLRYCHDLDFLLSAFNNGNVYIDNDFVHIAYRVHEQNTIKEDITPIKIEIASVVATALYEARTQIVNNSFSEQAILSFYRFLDNKGLAKLICFLLLWRGEFEHRSSFYDFVALPSRIDLLRSFVQ